MRWEQTARLAEQVTLEPEVAYLQSCRGYGHVPPCSSYLAHLRRWQRERDQAGGEAALKAQVGFWRRLEGR